MTIGMQRNNPWDLLPEHIPWFGLAAEQPDSGPLQFVNLVDGIRAGILVCYTYQRRAWNEPEVFVPKFAPASAGNPVAAYIENVCTWTGYTRNQDLNFHDPDVLTRWSRSIWRQEQGDAALVITDADILAAKALADAEWSKR